MTFLEDFWESCKIDLLDRLVIVGNGDHRVMIGSFMNEVSAFFPFVPNE